MRQEKGRERELSIMQIAFLIQHAYFHFQEKKIIPKLLNEFDTVYKSQLALILGCKFKVL